MKYAQLLRNEVLHFATSHAQNHSFARVRDHTDDEFHILVPISSSMSAAPISFRNRRDGSVHLRSAAGPNTCVLRAASEKNKVATNANPPNTVQTARPPNCCPLPRSCWAFACKTAKYPIPHIPTTSELCLDPHKHCEAADATLDGSAFPQTM